MKKPSQTFLSHKERIYHEREALKEQLREEIYREMEHEADLTEIRRLTEWGIQAHSDLRIAEVQLENLNNILSQYIRFVEIIKKDCPVTYNDSMTKFAKLIKTQ